MDRIGSRIKRKREQVGLQLNELSKKVGISSSALSQIENAKASPTISTLKRIAENLDTTVGELIGENEIESLPIIKRKEIKLLTTNEFGVDVFSLSNHGLNKIMDTFLLRFPEQSNSSGIFDKQSGQIFCYLTNGELIFELDNQTFNIDSGDSLYFNARRNFRFSNSSKFTAELICITSFRNF
ncbi:MAG: hypothetical protein BGO29_04140 [Bacteroidales bacterium 36-12]|nr:MAG: hypothetical protein BGO29_04140 [Bacteroidales bacterium 36-12]